MNKCKRGLREANYNARTFKFDNFSKFQNVTSDSPLHPRPLL